LLICPDNNNKTKKMNLDNLKSSIGNIDIYLLDQILKGKYKSGDTILDAGCGKGRNLKWFYQNDFTIYGIDAVDKNINTVKEIYPKQQEHFSVQHLDQLNFDDNKFDHIICSAVLHFAKSESHFIKMVSELVRVLKPNGTIFIRMTTIDGIQDKVKLIDKGVYHLPDGTNRFLLTQELLHRIQSEFNIQLIEPYKFVNVSNLRCMTTLVFKKP